ncbi:MAG: hypothetical protein ACUVT5_00855 [Candidatus Bathyarchaeales archaeon]
MGRENVKKQYSRVCRSRRATALPVTFLILFVSLILIITATYYVAMTRISARGQLLNFSAAKQSMTTLESNIENILWSTGASRVYYFDDFGGSFKILPTAKVLLVNVTDDVFFDIVFNSPVGKAIYVLSYAEPGASGLFLKGDGRAIVNSSASTMAQLQITTGETAQEITLSYRPFASVAVTGFEDGKPVNTVRIYVVNMNLSQSLTLSGGFYLKIRSINVVSTLRSYNLAYTVSFLRVKTVFDGKNGVVSLPISSGSTGVVINVETVVCNIQLQRVEV